MCGAAFVGCCSVWTSAARTTSASGTDRQRTQNGNITPQRTIACNSGASLPTAQPRKYICVRFSFVLFYFVFTLSLLSPFAKLNGGQESREPRWQVAHSPLFPTPSSLVLCLAFKTVSSLLFPPHWGLRGLCSWPHRRRDTRGTRTAVPCDPVQWRVPGLCDAFGRHWLSPSLFLPFLALSLSLSCRRVSCSLLALSPGLQTRRGRESVVPAAVSARAASPSALPSNASFLPTALLFTSSPFFLSTPTPHTPTNRLPLYPAQFSPC